MVGRHTQKSGGLQIDGKTVGGIVLIVAVLAAVVAGFAFLQSKRAQTADLDPKTFCPRSGPVAVHAVLIDRTDPLSDLQIEALQQDVRLWAKDVPKHGAFRIYEVGVGGTLLRPVVDVCNPGDGSDASQWDANPAFLRKRYQEKFLGPVTAMLAGMRGDAEQPNSPIMEAIQAIAVRDFGETGPSGDNALVVVSDLLEHTGHLDLYRGVPNAQVFAKSAEGRSLHADLNGVGVSVYLINRVKDAKFQTDALGTFWIQWLTQQGGDVGAFKQLPG